MIIIDVIVMLELYVTTLTTNIMHHVPFIVCNDNKEYARQLTVK